jgi:ABC-type cobalamin transport system permease subunit
VNFPPRTLLALGVIAVLVCLALGIVLVVLARRRVSRGSLALGVAVVLGIVGLVTWVALIWPAYWD